MITGLKTAKGFGQHIALALGGEADAGATAPIASRVSAGMCLDCRRVTLISIEGFSCVSFDYEQQQPGSQQEEQLERQQVDPHLQDLQLPFTAQQDYISFGEELDELDTEVEPDD
jgi:hypothetical protein